MNREKLGRTIVYGVALVCGSVALETSACSSAPKICLSPAAVSEAYPGDKTPGVNNKDQSTSRLGILATTPDLPRDASYRGLAVGFRDPTNANAQWHNSFPVVRTNDADKHIELALGQGDVQFKTQIQAIAGSAGCQQVPATTFSVPQPLKQISGTHPMWPS
jgi:hypothetical protein